MRTLSKATRGLVWPLFWHSGGCVKALGLGTVVILGIALSALLDEQSGVRIWLELRESLAGSSARVALLEAENDALRGEIELFETEPSALDRVIREELDLALPGETVVYFRPADGSFRPAAGSFRRAPGGFRQDTEGIGSASKVEGVESQ